MNGEIKEINIKTIEQLLDYVETEEKAKKLIDYITNLEQYYNDNVNKYEELLVKYSTLNRWYNSNKLRIDKAVKYITSEESINTFDTIESREQWLKVNKRLLNILTGGADEI